MRAGELLSCIASADDGSRSGVIGNEFSSPVRAR